MSSSIELAIGTFNGLLWDHLLIYVLLGAGAWFTLRLGFVQVRAFGQAVALLRHPPPEDGITPFQALATGIAARVGTGNIAGVAIAISLGGPGAVFWMWVTAAVGMASAFVEATLAQLYKVRYRDGSFRGGPAYYIELGLGSRALGAGFALAMVFTFGLVFSAVQVNSMADAFASAFGVPRFGSGLLVALIIVPVIFGGVRRVARVAQVLVPLVAFSYLGLALFVLLTHLPRIPDMLLWIVRSAFGLEQVIGGVGGYSISQAMSMGVKRGLFSNEAGMGSAPNAAAIATTHHPVTQGLLQMLGVFVDTFVICTATAVIILLSGEVAPGMQMSGAQLTQRALASEIGGFGGPFIAIVIGCFACTTIMGNYAYAESNLEYLRPGAVSRHLLRAAMVATVLAGSVLSLPLVWGLADATMGLMALANLAAIMLLGPQAIALWRDYQRQRQDGVTRPALAKGELPEEIALRLPKNVW